MRPVGFTLAALLASAPAVLAQAPPVPLTPTAPTGSPVPLSPVAPPGGPVPLSPVAPLGGPVPITTPGAGTGAPAFPVSSTPVAPAAAPSDPRLTQHLKGWEDAMRGTTNFRAEFELTRTESTFSKATEYSGSVLCMKPNLARLRLVEKTKPANYEAFICSGNAVFHYDGARKTMTQHMINPNVGANGGDNLMLDFLSGMKAADALARFDISLPKDPDQYYVYFLIKPKLPKDRQEFEEVRFAIYGATLPATHKHLSYLPSQVFVKKPNGDTEMWRFKDLQTNLVGVDAKVFQYEAPPKDWTIQQAPPQGGPPAPPMK